MKKSICFLIVFICLTNLYATSYEDVLSQAYLNNLGQQNNEIVYQNSILNREKREIKDEVRVSVNSGNISLLPTKDLMPSAANDLLFQGTSVEVVLPNDGNTTIKASGNLGFEYDDFSTYSFSPSITASHNFDLVGYDDEAVVSLLNSKTDLAAELSYQKSKLIFESQVLTLLKTIINLEKSIEQSENRIIDSQDAIENNLELGIYSMSSISYKNAFNLLEIEKDNLSSLKMQYKLYKDQYFTLTGLEYSKITLYPDYDLDLKVLDIGNTSVIIAAIEVEIAKEQINKTNNNLNPNDIRINGGLSSTISSAGNSLGFSAGANFSQSNWSVGTSFSGSYDNAKFTPGLTISGSWTNKVADTAQDIEMSVLINDLTLAQNSYQEALNSYQSEAQNLEMKILNFNYDLNQSQTNKNYLESNLAHQKSLDELGLDNNIEDAERELRYAEYNEILLHLDGLLRENEIKQLNL